MNDYKISEMKVVSSAVQPNNTNVLWLNNTDKKLYKFSNNGWEVTNNAPYIVDEFTVENLINDSKIVISRNFLDAMYKGVPIMVRKYGTNVTSPIKVYSINNPSENTQCTFEVTDNNITYRISVISSDVLTSSKVMTHSIRTFNSIDWNENTAKNIGYIANRTHYGGLKGTVGIGQRISLTGPKLEHYIGNYKLRYNEKFYDLNLLTQVGSSIHISNYLKITLMNYSVSGNTSSYTLISNSIYSGTLPSSKIEIYSDSVGSDLNTLDEFYLPDGAKPWKIITATPHTSDSTYKFKAIGSADVSNGENVIRNKVIYNVPTGGSIYIGSPTPQMLEFKIVAGGNRQINFEGKIFWENGELPQPSSSDEVIYSFLFLNGKTFASAKIYKQ